MGDAADDWAVVAKQVCANRPECQVLVDRGYCDGCRAKRGIASPGEAARPTANQRGYGYRWQKASAAYLEAHPIAVDWFGEHGGRVYAAEVVDHIVPHHGDMKLFWDRKNWQGLTKSDHDRKTALEDGGFGRKANGFNAIGGVG
jgi:5-methylcytosine-specific restriction enzyme A